MPARLVAVSRTALAVLAVTAAAATIASVPAEAAVAKPASLKLASGGSHNTSLKVQWGWKSGVSSYEVQAATDDSFDHIAKDVTVKGKAKKPAHSVMTTSLSGLDNATKFYIRVRSIKGSSTSGWSKTLTGATKVAWPSKITDVTAVAGPKAGEITFNWKQSGEFTTGYQLETALSLFSKTSGPTTGRNSHVYDIPAGTDSFTMSADQVAEAGAPLGSGVHLLYRFYAINSGTAGEQIRRYPYLQAIMPTAATSSNGTADARATGTALRIANFNVRTAKATSDARGWLARRASVAQLIKDRDPDIVSMQELGPGRADGQEGTTTGTMRQTTSLLDSLNTIGASNYKLVRTTPYVAPGATHGSQGVRILYNTDAVTLLSDCPDSTAGRNYSTSCSIELPLPAGDSETHRRTAAYAKFSDKKTGKTFWFVSAHLDERHSDNKATETAWNQLRGDQMSTILDAMDKINTSHLPVILGGDLNSWQNIAVGNAPHDELVGAGYFDTASAPTRINLQYSTFNNFEVTQQASGVGFASRLDGIYVLGGTATSFENVTKVTDDARPSDHNMVISNVVLTNS